MSVFVGEEDPEPIPQPRSRKKYETKYSSKYEEEYPWVGQSSKGDRYALCRLCQIDICIKSVGAKGLRDHEATGRHKQKASSYQQLAPPGPPHPSSHLNGAMYPVLEVESEQTHEVILGIPRPPTPQTPNTPLSPQDDLPPATSTAILDLGNPTAHMPTGIDPAQDSSAVKNPGVSLVIEYSQSAVDENYRTSSATKTDLEKASSKKESELTLSTDDLTCNVCGVVFAVWTQLKKHLLEHIMAAQSTMEGKAKGGRGRGRLQKGKNVKKASLPNQQENQEQLSTPDKVEVTTVKKRGRPKGSRNKLCEGGDPVLSQEPLSRPVRQRNSNPKYPALEEDDIDDPPIPEQETFIEHPSQNDVPEADEDEEEEPDDIADDNCLDEDVEDGSGGDSSKKKSGPRHCRVCREVFYNRLELKEHQRTQHNNGRPYQCAHCQKFFTTKNHLSVHVEHKHMSGPNPCQCAICGKILSSRTNLRIHMRIHKGERPFKCPICTKTFSRKANMEMHMVYHTGERKFTCEICGQSFFAINALRRHSKLHTGERDYACDICGATYVTGTDLKRHRLKHDDVKPYPCQLCAKQFTRSHDLKVHMRYHNKELRYTCEVCLKQFVESGNFKRHMRRHTGERPYSCASCLLTFSQVHHMKSHMKNCHSEEAVLPDDAVQETNSGRPRVIPHRNPRMSSKRNQKPQIQQPSVVPNHTNPQTHPHLNSHTQGAVTGTTIGTVGMQSSQTTSPPIAHQGGAAVPGTIASTHTTQIPGSGFLHQNYSPLYNHSVVPHYPSIFDMCPQQNCVSHLSSH